MDYNPVTSLWWWFLMLVCPPFGVYMLIRSLRSFAKAAKKPVRIPPQWEVDPVWVGDNAWRQIGLRCPELLGIAADRVLGRPVVDYLLKTARESDVRAEHKLALALGDLAELPSDADPEYTPKPVFFKDGEPASLAEYPGQPHITEYLTALIAGMPDTMTVPTEHQLLLGPAGQGKTLLVKCLTADLDARSRRLGMDPVQFLELVPADMQTLEQQDAMVRRASERPTVFFIDEIHDLTERHALKLYLLLEEGRYRFEGDPDLTVVRDVLVVAATTDYGALHAALKRRFNRHFLEPLNRQALEDILMRQPFPASSAAVEALVDRTHFSGAPWEALQLYRQAKVFAQGRHAPTVEFADAERVFQAQGVDELGLTRLDRRVIDTLLGQPRYRRGRGPAQEFVCYAASEADVVAMAGIDRGEYRESIKPKLMARGLLQVRPTYGQALTQRAVEQYRTGGMGRRSSFSKN